MLTQAELVGLLAEVAKGDTGAFERIYGATRSKLYGVLLRILGRPELADEVMQETYLGSGRRRQASIPPLPARSPGWSRSRAIEPSISCASGERPRSRTNLRRSASPRRRRRRWRAAR